MSRKNSTKLSVGDMLDEDGPAAYPVAGGALTMQQVAQEQDEEQAIALSQDQEIAREVEMIFDLVFQMAQLVDQQSVAIDHIEANIEDVHSNATKAVGDLGDASELKAKSYTKKSMIAGTGVGLGVGLIVGTIIFPGVGTLIGGGVGAAAGIISGGGIGKGMEVLAKANLNEERLALALQKKNMWQNKGTIAYCINCQDKLGDSGKNCLVCGKFLCNECVQATMTIVVPSTKNFKLFGGYQFNARCCARCMGGYLANQRKVKIVRQGLVKKQKPSAGLFWDKRQFVLGNNEAFYFAYDGKTSLGTLLRHEVTGVKIRLQEPCVLEIQADARNYVLSTKTEADAREWLRVIREAFEIEGSAEDEHDLISEQLVKDHSSNHADFVSNFRYLPDEFLVDSFRLGLLHARRHLFVTNQRLVCAGGLAIAPITIVLQDVTQVKQEKSSVYVTTVLGVTEFSAVDRKTAQAIFSTIQHLYTYHPMFVDPSKAKEGNRHRAFGSNPAAAGGAAGGPVQVVRVNQPSAVLAQATNRLTETAELSAHVNETLGANWETLLRVENRLIDIKQYLDRSTVYILKINSFWDALANRKNSLTGNATGVTSRLETWQSMRPDKHMPVLIKSGEFYEPRWLGLGKDHFYLKNTDDADETPEDSSAVIGYEELSVIKVMPQPLVIGLYFLSGRPPIIMKSSWVQKLVNEFFLRLHSELPVAFLPVPPIYDSPCFHFVYGDRSISNPPEAQRINPDELGGDTGRGKQLDEISTLLRTVMEQGKATGRHLDQESIQLEKIRLLVESINRRMEVMTEQLTSLTKKGKVDKKWLKQVEQENNAVMKKLDSLNLEMTSFQKQKDKR